MTFFGFQKTTLIDYPHEIATTVFTGGCNFHCPFCHNPELVNATGIPRYSSKEIIDHITKHKGKITALCITGGEPLLYKERLIDFIDEVRSIGIKVKLDTNGSQPLWLKKANVDFIAMDIKSSYSKYKLFVDNINDEELINNIKESVNYILNSNIEYEFRTTVVPELVTKDDIRYIAEHIIPNAKRYFLNQFRPEITLDKRFMNVTPYSNNELQEMSAICAGNGIDCYIR